MIFEGRFWEKVDVRGADDCWPWLAAKSVRRNGKRDPIFSMRADDARALGLKTSAKEHAVVRACRLMLALAGDSPVDDEEVHHECERTDCMNPTHLAWKTQGGHIRVHHGDRCSRGHLRSDNRFPSGRRGCRACQRLD